MSITISVPSRQPQIVQNQIWRQTARKPVPYATISRYRILPRIQTRQWVAAAAPRIRVPNRQLVAKRFVEVRAMMDLPELPFSDTVMTTLVFYGPERRLPIRNAKELIENICRLLGEEPSNAHVGLDETGQKSRKPKWKMLGKVIDEGNFEKYSFIEAANYFEKGNVRDLSLKVGVNQFAPAQSIIVQFKKDRTAPVNFSDLLREVLNYLTPDYGISYGMTVHEGPSWFASGVASSGMPEGVWQASSEFRNEYFFGKKFADGFFRDVFKWNYLSSAHLDKAIEGMRFHDWVEEPLKNNGWLGKAKSRGTLTALGHGGAVWELTKDEGAEVRPRMLAAGLLMVKN